MELTPQQAIDYGCLHVDPAFSPTFDLEDIEPIFLGDFADREAQAAFFDLVTDQYESGFWWEGGLITGALPAPAFRACWTDKRRPRREWSETGVRPGGSERAEGGGHDHAVLPAAGDEGPARRGRPGQDEARNGPQVSGLSSHARELSPGLHFCIVYYVDS